MKEKDFLLIRLKKRRLSFDEAVLYLSQLGPFAEDDFVTLKVRVGRRPLGTIKVPKKEKDSIPAIVAFLLESAGYDSVNEIILPDHPGRMRKTYTVDNLGTTVVLELQE